MRQEPTGCQAVLSSITASSLASEPLRPSRPRAAADALDRLGRELVDRRRARRVARRVDDRVDVAVAAQRREQLVHPPAQKVQGPGRARPTRPRPRRGRARAPASGARRSRRPCCPPRAPGRSRARGRAGRARPGRDGDDAGRLGGRERQVRRGDRVDAAHHRGELVRPARVVHERVDRGAELVAGRVRGEVALRDARAGELVAARLERLGEAVEDLAAVVRRRFAQPACAPRAALTASRTSLRDARGTFATWAPAWSAVGSLRPDSERANAPPT